MAAQKVKAQGRALRAPQKSGAKRNAYLAFKLADYTPYTLTALPASYAIFQSYWSPSGSQGKIFDTYIYGSDTVDWLILLQFM